MIHYSPGPWEVAEHNNTRLPTDVTARGGEDWIADCGRLNGLNLETCVANAQLIAAAPELLDAAKRGIAALEANGAPNCEAAKELRRAVAKAMGW